MIMMINTSVYEEHRDWAASLAKQLPWTGPHRLQGLGFRVRVLGFRV
jgi:hypothetical protein